jgi:hypothetical protein
VRAQRFDTRGLRLAYDSAFDAMLASLERRYRLDDAIAAMAAGGRTAAAMGYRLSSGEGAWSGRQPAAVCPLEPF